MTWLNQTIQWTRTGDVYAPYGARVDEHVLKLRLGDFPAEPLYTRLVDDVEVLSLDSVWPFSWKAPIDRVRNAG